MILDGFLKRKSNSLLAHKHLQRRRSIISHQVRRAGSADPPLPRLRLRILTPICAARLRIAGRASPPPTRTPPHPTPYISLPLSPSLSLSSPHPFSGCPGVPSAPAVPSRAPSQYRLASRAHCSSKFGSRAGMDVHRRSQNSKSISFTARGDHSFAGILRQHDTLGVLPIPEVLS